MPDCIYRHIETIDACGGPRRYAYCSYPSTIDIKKLCKRKYYCPKMENEKKEERGLDKWIK